MWLVRLLLSLFAVLSLAGPRVCARTAQAAPAGPAKNSACLQADGALAQSCAAKSPDSGAAHQTHALATSQPLVLPAPSPQRITRFLDLDPFLARFLDGPALARFAAEKGTTRELGLLIREEARVLEGCGKAAEAARLAEKAEFLLAAAGPA